MDELIARLEAASEGSRELDLAIWNAVSKDEWRWWKEDNETITCDRYGPGAIGNPICSLDQFSRSLDAALTLLKEGWGWTCNKTITFDCGAQVFGHDIHADGNAKTPALAMCSAALRARSHTAPQEK